jgi:hypothetical protein
MLLVASIANAGIHTWDVREVYSNASGSIQYIELIDNGSGGTEFGVGNGSITSNGQTHSWTNGPVTGPTNGKSYLIASASFDAIPGTPTPDVIIPVGKLPFFNPAGDTVGFSSGDSWTFGAVPTNGTNSLDRDSGAGARTPKNYAGLGAFSVPTASFWTTAGLIASLAAMGMIALRRYRAGVQS